jgi:hypothetical protein
LIIEQNEIVYTNLILSIDVKISIETVVVKDYKRKGFPDGNADTV